MKGLPARLRQQQLDEWPLPSAPPAGECRAGEPAARVMPSPGNYPAARLPNHLHPRGER
jgi:hypothetical protein